MHLAEAADPLRLSAERAEPSPKTSDVLCRPEVLTRSLQLPRSPANSTRSFGKPAETASLRTRIIPRRRWFRTQALSSRTPSIGLMLNREVLRLSRLRSRSQSVHAFVTPHPFGHHSRFFPLSTERPAVVPYPTSARIASRLTLRICGKIRLTDFCNQHTSTSTREPLDSRAPQRALRCDHLRAASEAKGNKSDEVRRHTAFTAIKPRVETRLTAVLQLRSLHTRLSITMVETNSTFRRR